MWTMPVPSSSPTSSQATTRCSYGVAGSSRVPFANAARTAGSSSYGPGVAPADELAPRLLPRAPRTGPRRRCLSVPLPSQKRVVALADPRRSRGLRPDGRRHVGGEGPRRRRPDEQRLAGPVDQREAHRQPGVLAVLVALVHLHLADAGAAARAPGHRVVALVDPAAPVALREEAPDQVVVLVAEGEVAAADVGHAEPPDEHLDRVGDRPVGARDRRLLRGSSAEQVAQPAQLVGVVPVHPEAEPDRLLGLARGVGQDALLAQGHEARRCRTPRCRACS